MRREAQHNFLPFLKRWLRDVKFPVDLGKKDAFIRVDLCDLETGHLAPRFRGVVAVLEILRGQDECRQEDSTTAHQRARRRAV